MPHTQCPIPNLQVQTSLQQFHLLAEQSVITLRLLNQTLTRPPYHS
ncbi:MAG: hypothetical protein V7K88_24540 [Nostoc sp.]